MSAPAATAGPVPVMTRRRNVRPTAWMRLLRNPMAAFGLALLLVVVAIVLLAPVLPLQPPEIAHLALRLKPPLTPDHVLGTDQVGRDILSRLIWGTRLSLAVGVFAALMSCLIGSTIGLLAAFRGGWLDTLLMRGIDTLMAFPYLLLALAIVAALGPGLFNAMLAIIVVNVPFFARGVRGAALSVVRTDFMAAARLCGLSDTRIVLSELLPNVLPGIIIGVSTTVGWMILETAGLSFLGLGAQPPQADLGGMLGEGRNLLQIAPHVATIPGLVILLLAIGVNLLGDGLRDVLDPKLKAGHLARSQARTDAEAGTERRIGLPPPMSDARLPLAIRKLRTEFRVGRSTHAAVGGVDISIAPGEAVGIVGESGSGKTVMALSVLGLVASPPGRIVGGEILHHGEDMAEADLGRLQEVRGGKIAYVFQDPQTTLNPLIPVGEQVAETIRRHQGVSRAEAMRRAVTLFGSVLIPDASEKVRAYPHELSGGQRQRVGIAMALANDPELIIADEPTTALDVTTQAQVLKLLNDLRRDRGAALLFISHDFGVVAALCDRVHVMYAGRVVESGPVRAVLQHPRHPYTQRLLACVPELGARQRRVAPIPGLPPSTDALPPGCAFAPRCHLAIPACSVGEIGLDPVGPEHLGRCIRMDQT
ncbi:dipeptide/oligopeptide/nickel ABC transporter permease/ATP-binding protein [Lichenihabitans psoromatis]|uniref:dipeptide/oligopeptide/nickel ABC transporter permease/ATP-binding protein n=1 Tax=Lichenihabitans psoromatis TaxID=2528642 RepID=UPI00103848AA|nr:dipeptide/oligopeptide/nickel ABC transporter permease/ATP-binding protein [Lichenihabitans psoromatis]